MPYKKYRRKRRYSRRSQPWYRKKYSAMEIADKAYRGMKYLKSVVNVEKKIQDTSISTSPTSSGYVTPLTQILQGDGINNRDGNSVKVTYLGLRGNFTANDAHTLTRMIVFRDNQQIGDTTPSVSDVLQSADPNSFLNQNTLGRFKVLLDRRYQNTDAGNNKGIAFKHDLSLQHHVRYNGAAATDVQKGGLYILLVSDDAVGPNIAIECRVRFVDN